MQIHPPRLHILRIANAVIGEASLPNRRLRRQPMREASFDQAHRPLHGDALRRENQVNVIGHDHKRVKFVAAGVTIVLQGFEKELRVCGNLEQTPTIVGRASEEKRAEAWCSGGSRHAAIVRRVPQGLKPIRETSLYGTDKSVPLTKRRFFISTSEKCLFSILRKALLH